MKGRWQGPFDGLAPDMTRIRQGDIVDGLNERDLESAWWVPVTDSPAPPKAAPAAPKPETTAPEGDN